MEWNNEDSSSLVGRRVPSLSAGLPAPFQAHQVSEERLCTATTPSFPPVPHPIKRVLDCVIQLILLLDMGKRILTTDQGSSFAGLW